MKKFILGLFLIVSCAFAGFAQQYYANSEKGWSGESTAEYLGESTQEEVSSAILLLQEQFVPSWEGNTGTSFQGHVETISQEELFLIESALNETEVQSGEIYGVTYTKNGDIINNILVLITSSGNEIGYCWWSLGTYR